MKRVLIPTDFSGNSISVCKYAASIIGSGSAEILLFYILPDMLMVPDSSFPAGIDSNALLNSDYLNVLKEQAVSNMQQLEKQLLKFVKDKGFSNISISTGIGSGDAEWEIMDACEHFAPDVIVMGTRGSGNKGFLEGSMAGKIMSKANIPVIAVPDECSCRVPGKILYATNFNENDYRKLVLLFKLFEKLDVVIYVTHFNIDGKQEQGNEKMNELKLAFKEERSKGKIFFNIINSLNKDASLGLFCQEFEIDMIAFISHRTNIFKNLFSHKIHKKDFFKLNLPMTALHD
jgi:nucleotide-binding universal stress UspA family protein